MVTLEELLEDPALRDVDSQVLEQALADLRSSRQALRRRGTQPDNRIATQVEGLNAPAPSRRTAPASGRSTGQNRRASASGQNTGQNASAAAPLATQAGRGIREGTLATGRFLESGVIPVRDTFNRFTSGVARESNNFVSGLLGREPQQQTSTTPAQRPVDRTTGVANPGGQGQSRTQPQTQRAPSQATPPLLAAPARQTSFTNADAENLSRTVNTVPALDTPDEPSQFESLLLEAIGGLAAPRSQATLIRDNPDQRIAGSAFERRAQLRERALDQGDRALRNEREAARGDRNQTGRNVRANLLAQLLGGEQRAAADTAVAQTEAQSGENQLQALRAQRLRLALSIIGASIEAGEELPSNLLGLLLGEQEDVQPIEGLTGTVGTFNSRGARLFDDSVLDRLSPTRER